MGSRWSTSKLDRKATSIPRRNSDEGRVAIEDLKRKHEQTLNELTRIDEKLKRQQRRCQQLEEFQKSLKILPMNQDQCGKSVTISNVEYRITKTINTGGFSTIYQAHSLTKDKNTNNTTYIAVKFVKHSMSKQAYKQIRKESRLLEIISKQVKSENTSIFIPIVDYFGSYSELGRGTYVALEKCQFDLFTFWIKHRDSQDRSYVQKMAFLILFHVIRALSFLEKLQIVHGDIKPENILVASEESPFSLKLCDFGTSYYVNPTAEVDERVYTDNYAPPELKNSNTLYVSSDVYSSGVMFYWFLYQKFPKYYKTSSHIQSQQDFNDMLQFMLESDPIERMKPSQMFAECQKRYEQLKLDSDPRFIAYSVPNDISKLHMPCQNKFNIPMAFRVD